jgi:hypothetical protein
MQHRTRCCAVEWPGVLCLLGVHGPLSRARTNCRYFLRCSATSACPPAVLMAMPGSSVHSRPVRRIVSSAIAAPLHWPPLPGWRFGV